MNQFQAMEVGLGVPGFFGTGVVVVAALIVIIAWVVLAGSRFAQGGTVEHPARVPQLYGYTACLVGLFWALTSAVGLAESSLTLSAPAYHRANEFGLEPSITSFEAFRLTYDRARRFNSPDVNGAKLDSVPEIELRKRYETYRADRIASTVVEARQSLVSKSFQLVLAIGVFAFHWRWLKRKTAAA